MKRYAVGINNGNFRSGLYDNRKGGGVNPDDFNAYTDELAQVIAAIKPLFSKEKWNEWMLENVKPDGLILERAKAEYRNCWNQFMDSPLPQEMQ